MKSFLFLLIVLLLCTVAFSTAQTRPAAFRAVPGVGLPLAGDREWYTPGGGMDLSGTYALPFFPMLSAGIDAAYSWVPLKKPDSAEISPGSLSFISGGVTAVLGIPIGTRFEINAVAEGGYFYAMFNDDPGTGGGNPYIRAGAGAAFYFNPGFGIQALASYRRYLGLYNDVYVGIGTVLRFGTPRERVKREGKPKPEPSEVIPKELDMEGEGVDIVSVEFVNIFPVFFKYYDSNPIGKAVIRNFEDTAVKNVKLSLFVKQYMDNPKEAIVIDSMEPGEEQTVDVFGLFTNNVLDITEGTKVSALINISYQIGGQEQSKEIIETIRLQNRNAITWDDDRKACAFVTAKDPAVLKFSKNVAGWIRDSGSRALNKNLKIAMALHEALDLYGISYVIDPTTPYIEFSEDALAIDYLQFPKQTLEFLAGDCDDLSILYSSLLEAAGIETAFVTTPGHIFVAFNLKMHPDDARKSFLYPDELIFREGKTWLPVEITVRGGGFLKAWQAGAKEWRENEPKDLAGFFPMHEAWTLYEPVGFPGTVNITLPDRDDIKEAFTAESERFIGREISPQLARIQNEIDSNQGDRRSRNKLGVLYARYGLDSKAMDQFEKVLSREEYLPALLNTGNLYYLQENLNEARKYYLRAEALSPDNPKVLLAVARVDHELENYGTARAAYSKLKDINPDLASRFAYLDLRGDEASRAADVSQVKGVVLWEEE